ncbi:MAG TPA: amino acid adenylation domain-containing protein [Polyangiaceae bacterium]|nr:amino acid adenylation domain-containing protein [Polyangiaceae bacterium]
MRLLKDVLLSAAASTPDGVAVICPERGAVRYGELDELANRVARALLRGGVRAGDRVGVFMPKSADALAAMQAALRIGAAYVPLDPSSPVARIQTITNDCRLAAMVGDEARLAALGEDTGAALPFTLALDEGALAPFDAGTLPDTAATLDGNSLAYILYTSGSTGVPKGVALSQENALAFIDWATALLEVTPADVLANHAPFHFDLSVLDVYAAWSAGASVALVPEMAAFSPRQLVEFVGQHGVSVWYSVPSAVALMLHHGGLFEPPPPALRVVCCAGEAFPPRLLAALRAGLPSARLLNLYGPTETNVCTFHEAPAAVDGETPVPIGVAACGDEVWAVKDDGARATPGETGELCVTGPTVMLGYWGQEPHPRGAPYRTGDQVLVRHDGGFDYLGRRDRMVKLKGHRVELGEVETALGLHPEIGAVAAAVVGSGTDARLVAVAVARGERRVPLLELKAHCAKHVPRYMIVDRVVWVDTLPRTPNGKLDRGAIASACL